MSRGRAPYAEEGQSPRERLALQVHGAVQGVGFRPFVYTLAHRCGLAGWVGNNADGVLIEVEGAPVAIDGFLRGLEDERPPLSRIEHVERAARAVLHEDDFRIVESAAGGHGDALVLPDIAVCPACQAEMRDPANRRYRYPFINCTHCGPRYTIVERLPYDRPHTTMRAFAMCPACRTEYEDPMDRRFHAQPIACPVCGPQLSLWDDEHNVLAEQDDALRRACAALMRGDVVAVKGLGGFHLLALARSQDAVARLRARKGRPDKPFALMYPKLSRVKVDCHVDGAEAALLTSAESPIVLLRRREVDDGLAADIAPGVSEYGVMLPYTPLHHLILEAVGEPLVATSGNRSSEPICIDEQEALFRLKGIADLFLVHDRPILRPVDDSIARVVEGRPMLLRRARGFAPFPIAVTAGNREVLAVGGHLKSTVAVSKGKRIFVSQYLGDLSTPHGFDSFVRTARDLPALFDVVPGAVAYDPHPDYLSARFARRHPLPRVPVQHHYAHVIAVMAEHKLEETVTGFAWDGSGYGTDRTIWGGEVLDAGWGGFDRIASLRTFPLPGGERAVEEPRRAALGMLHALGVLDTVLDLPTCRAFDEPALTMLVRMLARNLNTPLTSSMGRLFDAVASLLGVRQTCTWEGQAALDVEMAARSAAEAVPGMRLALQSDDASGEVVMDWTPLLQQLVSERPMAAEAPAYALGFHHALVEASVALAHQAGREAVVLGGGCFQNALLLRLMVTRLRNEGFRVYHAEHVPPNDAAISVGQAAFAMRQPVEEGAQRCALRYPAE